MKECFECGATEELQEHHVVPKSRGGTKTVTLCYSCHMKAHGRDSKGMRHNRLCKEGINKAIKKHGKCYWGNQRGIGLDKAHQAHKTKSKQHDEKVGNLAIDMLEDGFSYGQISDKYNQLKIPTLRAGKWNKGSIYRMTQRIKKNNLLEDK